MDNSQSSDVFSSLTNASNNSLLPMDSLTYESLISNTKSSLSCDIQREISKTNFCTYFTSLLEDCAICINQGQDLTIELLQDTTINTRKLIEFIEDAICIVQLLSNFIKSTIESVSMACCTLKTFPTTTGNILMTVFKHCKDSETIYGTNLTRVGKQLKDLFRTCHELQLTYLMILEKHFVFDLTEIEEQKILIDALHINLRIGEIVQTLDVKTMAEQWKAYTMICEKYSTYLSNKYIYDDCSQVLCTMITNNLGSSLEDGADEKVVIRSLKVTNFIIKILMKVVTIFKHVKCKEDNHILETLVYIYLNNDSYLALVGKSPQFINLMKTNVLIPTDNLLKELLHNESFTNSMFQYDLNNIKKEDKLLGYVVQLISMMRLMVQDQSQFNCKQQLISCIFDIIPYCHIWFNMKLQFQSESINSERTTYGLYEHLLIHTAALTITLSSEDMNVVERCMYEALLGTDCCLALFSSNLWILLARMSPSHIVLDQTKFLCGTYQTLESQSLFENSPQKLYLSYTLTRLFELLNNDEKMELFVNFNPFDDENNINLWIALKMSNFNIDFKREHENKLQEKCNTAFEHFVSSNVQIDRDIENLIKLLQLLSTFCVNDKFDDYIIKFWMKACPGNNVKFKSELDNCTLCYMEFMSALVKLTSFMMNTLFIKSTNLIKVLHVISKIIQNDNVELKLLMIEPLCALATTYKPENKTVVHNLVSESFRRLFADSNVLVKSKLLCKLTKYMRDIKMEKIITILNEDHNFRENWRFFLEHGRLKNHSKTPLKEQLIIVTDFNYIHKCIVVNYMDCDFLDRVSGSNFDFTDIDNLFEIDSDSEPSSKKVKYTNETLDIITRLENDATLLCNLKENVFDVETVKRIKSVCEKLKNIIH